MNEYINIVNLVGVNNLQETTDRVRQMELYFDMLQNVVNTNPDTLREDASLQAMLHILTQYYEGGQWLQDYELDEKGFLPQNLKRGVLAQDPVYDFLGKIKDIVRGGKCQITKIHGISYCK